MKKTHIIMDDSNDQGVQEAESTPVVEEAERTDWKAKAIEWETKFKSENGIRRRLEKDLKQTKTEPPSEAVATQESKGFDYAQKAYLKSSGIEQVDFDFVKDVMQSTGKSLDEVLDSKYFQAELKERKDTRMTEAATPSGSKRAGISGKDTVDYWLEKIKSGQATVKDIPDRKLRIQVVNARYKKDTNDEVFYDS